MCIHEGTISCHEGTWRQSPNNVLLFLTNSSNMESPSCAFMMRRELYMLIKGKMCSVKLSSPPEMSQHYLGWCIAPLRWLRCINSGGQAHYICKFLSKQTAHVPLIASHPIIIMAISTKTKCSETLAFSKRPCNTFQRYLSTMYYFTRHLDNSHAHIWSIQVPATLMVHVYL